MNDFRQLSHQLCSILCNPLNQQSIEVVKGLLSNDYCDCNVLFTCENSQDTPLTILTRKLTIQNEKIVNNMIVQMFGLFSYHQQIRYKARCINIIKRQICSNI